MNDLKRFRGVEPYWYLATPYSKYLDGLDQSYWDGSRASGFLHRHDIPHIYAIGQCHTAAKLGGLDPRDGFAWQRRLQPLIERSGGLIIVKMPGWDDSDGIAEEIRIFTEAGKPIEHLEWPL